MHSQEWIPFMVERAYQAGTMDDDTLQQKVVNGAPVAKIVETSMQICCSRIMGLPE